MSRVHVSGTVPGLLRSPRTADEDIGWELLATLDSEDVARLDIGPGDLQESLDLPGDHQIVYCLEVDLVRHFALPQLQREVSHAHQHEVDRQRNDRERNSDLIVLLRVEDQEKESIIALPFSACLSPG